MLFQISFGHGPTTMTIAQQYVEADSCNQAWAMGYALCQPREVVQEVLPVHTEA
jgi:hypothetical protein